MADLGIFFGGMHPGIIFILGAILIPLFTGRIRQLFLLFIPLLALINLMNLPANTVWIMNFVGYELILLQIDNLSICFAYVFVIMAFLGALYAAHVKEEGQHIAAFLYVGSALCVVFTRDLFTLFIFWEVMAISSVFLIWYRREKASLDAGFRYIMVHAFGGSCLMAGIVIHLAETGSIIFEPFSTSLASILILIGFMVNAAVPPLHAWLSDAYPEGTVTGSVFLSAFTTKTAVYVLIRAFSGWEILIYLGTMMTLYGIVYAILENDMRRILAYSIINQVGFMVAGVGIGTALALNGSASHAFGHILYKGLLWMSAGAVLYMTGKTKCTELGGLYKTMPYTLIFCLVGAASISAFPLFSGFTTKSMIISAAAEEHLLDIFLLLQLASAGVFLHAGIKFPYFVFFAKDSGIRTRDPPINMLAAMAIASFLCIFLGIYPQPLYSILPTEVHYNAYTAEHVVWQLQLLMFSALAFFVMLPLLKRTETITVDVDWLYRKPAEGLMWFIRDPLMSVARMIDKAFSLGADSFIWFARNPTGALKIAGNSFRLAYLGSVDPHRAAKLTRQLEKQKRVYRDRDEQMTIGVGVLLLVLILLMYLLIYVVGLGF